PPPSASITVPTERVSDPKFIVPSLNTITGIVDVSLSSIRAYKRGEVPAEGIACVDRLPLASATTIRVPDPERSSNRTPCAAVNAPCTVVVWPDAPNNSVLLFQDVPSYLLP